MRPRGEGCLLYIMGVSCRVGLRIDLFSLRLFFQEPNAGFTSAMFGLCPGLITWYLCEPGYITASLLQFLMCDVGLLILLMEL